MTRLLGIREAGVWLAYEIIPEVPLPVTWGIVPMFLLAFRTFFWQVQQMNFSYSLPCEHETSSVPVQGARWHRRVALLVLTGLVAFLWMSSRDLLFCRRNGWTLWFTVTMGPGTWKARASQSSSVLTHEFHSVLWAENHPELPGKMLQLGWKSVASLELYMCPKFCSHRLIQITREELLQLKLYLSWGKAQGLLSQAGQGSGSHNSGLRWVVGSQHQPAGLPLLCPPPVPNLHPRERQKLLWSLGAKAAESHCGNQVHVMVHGNAPQFGCLKGWNKGVKAVLGQIITLLSRLVSWMIYLFLNFC